MSLVAVPQIDQKGQLLPDLELLLQNRRCLCCKKYAVGKERRREGKGRRGGETEKERRREGE
jgi:hypothetical protein